MDKPLTDETTANLAALTSNPYPGRGIVIGQSPDARHYVQIYWIMGRSANSRNRIFAEENGSVHTAPFDPSLVEDPSLIIYNCLRVHGSRHIVTNGDHTDTVFEALDAGGSFESALYSRDFEPDAPNYTPRIAGILDLDSTLHRYQLGILKTLHHDANHQSRQVFNYSRAIPGAGHYISTYEADGSPLPSFSGEPRLMPLSDDIDQTIDTYWDALDKDNRVSLLVKFIDAGSGMTDLRIRNVHGS